MRFKNIITTIAIVFLLVSNAAAVNFRKIVLEDMSIGSGTYTSPSGKVTGKTKINAGSFPFKPSALNTKSPNDWADRGFDTPIYPGTLISGGPETSIQKYDADGSGAISGSEFAAMVSGIGATQTTVLIDVFSTVSANVSTPSTLTFRFISPGKLIINTGVTLTIDGYISAPFYKIFDYAGTGVVAYDTSARYPQWWGALGDGVSDDTAAIQQALDLNSGCVAGGLTVCGGIVELPPGIYKTTSTLNVYSHTIFRGSGTQSTQINYQGSLSAISLDDDVNGLDYVSIQDMWIECPGGSVSGQHGIYIQGTRKNCSILRVKIRAPGDTGIYIYSWCHNLLISHCTITGASNGWGIQILKETSRGTNNNLITMCSIDSNKGGIYLKDGIANQIFQCLVSGNGTNGNIKFEGEFNSIISNCYMEHEEASTSNIIFEDTNHCYIFNNYLAHQATANDSIGVEFIGNSSENVIRENRFTLNVLATGTNVAIDFSALTVADEPNKIDQMWGTFGSAWTTNISDTNDNAEFRLPGNKFGLWGDNQQYFNISQKTTELTSMSGATITWTNAIPAGSMVFGISARVTTLVTGATTMDIGESGGDTDLYIDGMAVAANTTADIADSNAALVGPKAYQSTTSVLVTAVGGAANFSAGALRLTLYYIELTPPTD